MKLVVMVMSVVEVNKQQSVQCSIGLDKEGKFVYLGSINPDFEQMGFIDSILRKVPEIFLVYRRAKWQTYLDNIIAELMKL